MSYNLFCYINDQPKKTKKQPKEKDSRIVYNKQFNLSDLDKSTKEKLYRLYPNFKSTSYVDFTVENILSQEQLNEKILRFEITQVDDLAMFYGIHIDMDSIITYPGKVYIKTDLPLKYNRTVSEDPKIEICINVEFLEYFVFNVNDTANNIISRCYQNYGHLRELIENKLYIIEKRKRELVTEFQILLEHEDNRLAMEVQKENEAITLYENTKSEWILTKGSSHLKLLYNLNYHDECDKKYLEERLGTEFHGWFLDSENRGWFLDSENSIECKKSVIPSIHGLMFKEQLNKMGYYAEIVSITRGISQFETGSEALVIPDYLYKFKLYKKLM